jgi:hypothetical protein
MRRETLAAIAGLALIHATEASAQIPAVCAKDFVKSPAVATGIEYGVRESAGQRWCEGTFITPVGATQLTVEHFTQPFVPVDTSARRIESLNVECAR